MSAIRMNRDQQRKPFTVASGTGNRKDNGEMKYILAEDLSLLRRIQSRSIVTTQRGTVRRPLRSRLQILVTLQ